MAGLLTNIQKELVEKNHNLIYEFAYSYNLSIYDYYDILAIGLCKAASVFDSNKGAFSTIAYNCMRNELYKFWRHTMIQRSIPDELICSYDAPVNNEYCDDSINYLDSLTDGYSVADIVESNMRTEILISMLNKKEKLIVQLLINGMTQTEIAQKFGCSKQRINERIKKIRDRFSSYLKATC